MRGMRGAGFAVIALVCACSAQGGNPFFETSSPIRVIETTPEDGAAEVPLEPVIEIELNGEIAVGSLVGAITLTKVGGSPIAVTTLREGRLISVGVAAGVSLELASQYEVTVEGLTDTQGRPVPALTFAFTTLAPPAVAVEAEYPLQGSTAPGNFVVRVVFNVAIDEALLGPSAVVVNGGSVGGTIGYEAVGNTLTFTPNAPVNGAVSVAVAGVTDAFGRSFDPPDWSFTAQITTVDADRPALPGSVSASETSAGTITVTFDAATDDVWTGAPIRYEALLTKLPPPAPAGCVDAFEPQTVRVATHGITAASGALVASGLDGGRWSVFLEAVDGSGRRSLPKEAAATITLANGAALFATVIQPLLDERCAFAGCHVGSNAPGFVDYTDPRETIVAHESQANMPLVTPYCLDRSYLWRKLTPGMDIEGQRMPPEGVEEATLTRRERELFRRWILDQGGE